MRDKLKILIYVPLLFCFLLTLAINSIERDCMEGLLFYRLVLKGSTIGGVLFFVILTLFSFNLTHPRTFSRLLHRLWIGKHSGSLFLIGAVMILVSSLMGLFFISVNELRVELGRFCIGQ